MNEAKIETIGKEVFADGGLLRQFVEDRNGKFFVDLSALNNIELMLLAETLNDWNAHQEISDSQHTAHYNEYIHQLHVERENRTNSLINRLALK